MIDPQTIDLSSLPSVPLSDRKSLPAQTGIYFAIDSQNNIQYIGKAGGKAGIRGRWAGHSRYDELKEIGGVRIAYLFIDDQALLLSIERALIAWFDPPLNEVKILHQGNVTSSPQEASSRLVNKIKQFLDSRGVTPYQFERDAKIAHRTAYDLYKNPNQIPSGTVLSKICETYRIQPGEILEWEPKA